MIAKAQTTLVQSLCQLDDSLNDEDNSIKDNCNNRKAKLICQFVFFFSSLEGDFSWPVASFPLQKINHQVLSSLIWKACEALGNLHYKDKNRLQVLDGVCDGSILMLFSHVQVLKTGLLIILIMITNQFGGYQIFHI